MISLTSLYDEIIRSNASAPDDNKFLLTVNCSVRALIPSGSPIGSTIPSNQTTNHPSKSPYHQFLQVHHR